MIEKISILVYPTFRIFYFTAFLGSLSGHGYTHTSIQEEFQSESTGYRDRSMSYTEKAGRSMLGSYFYKTDTQGQYVAG